MSSSKTCWSGTWHNYMTSSYESRSNVSSTGWPRIRPCAGSSARGRPAQRSLYVLRDCPPKPTGPSETRFAGLLSIELRCVLLQGPLTASSSVYMREGAQITGLGAEAGPTPAARATQAHGPEYPATLAVLAFSSCQDQLEHPTARSQPLSCVRALNVLSGHAVNLQRAALLPQCALPCSFNVLQFFVTSGAGRVPNMSAPGSSDGQDGRKAKRDFPRSHFRADGTRRRTAGEKQARKSWSRRQDADDQPRWRQPAENRPQWRKKDSAQEANEGWGVNLHTSGASAGQRQQPAQWSSEQDPQGSPPKPEQEPTSDAKAPSQSTDTGSPKCPQLLIRLPDYNWRASSGPQGSDSFCFLIDQRMAAGRFYSRAHRRARTKPKPSSRTCWRARRQRHRRSLDLEPLAIPLRAPSSAPDWHRPLRQGGP